MPGIEEHSQIAKLLNRYAEIERLLFQSHEIVLRSSIRVSQAHRTLTETGRANAQFRQHMNECRRLLDLARGS